MSLTILKEHKIQEDLLVEGNREIIRNCKRNIAGEDCKERVRDGVSVGIQESVGDAREEGERVGR